MAQGPHLGFRSAAAGGCFLQATRKRGDAGPSQTAAAGHAAAAAPTATPGPAMAAVVAQGDAEGVALASGTASQEGLASTTLHTSALAGEGSFSFGEQPQISPAPTTPQQQQQQGVATSPGTARALMPANTPFASEQDGTSVVTNQLACCRRLMFFSLNFGE